MDFQYERCAFGNGDTLISFSSTEAVLLFVDNKNRDLRGPLDWFNTPQIWLVKTTKRKLCACSENRVQQEVAILCAASALAARTLLGKVDREVEERDKINDQVNFISQFPISKSLWDSLESR